MLKWVLLIAIAGAAALGTALPRTKATLPADSALHSAQVSFARAAPRRCGKRGASRYCRSAQGAKKRSAHTNLPPNLMIGIGF